MAETVLKFLLLSYLSSFVTSSCFIDFRRISKKCISWRMLTKLQQGRQSRTGWLFAFELQDFKKANAWKIGAVVESVKI